MKSSMFLSNISVVDHAYIDHRGNIVGGSFNPSFIVSGEIDHVEQVVVDFSAVKKQIKSIIDHPETGIDHKLWFMVGWSKGEIHKVGEYYNITTPTTSMVVPVNSVRVMHIKEYSVDAIGLYIASLVDHELSKLHPKINIVVECINNIDRHFPTSASASYLFRYSHGLKCSTSWGCKNIAHGHLSYIQLLPSNTAVFELTKDIAEDLDDVVFVFNENIIKQDSEFLTVGYTSETRGKFEATYLKSAYKIIILETETTVENLVEYVTARYYEELKDLAVRKILVSEGLSKGAMVTLDF